MLFGLVILYGLCLGINLLLPRWRPDWLRPRRRPPGSGDLTCDYNAHSPWLRWAVNPAGPCRSLPGLPSLSAPIRGG